MNKNIDWCEDFMFNLEYIRYAETFYALQVPIYYYVKTKGSLANKNMGLTKIIKMKLSVFEYYTQFYQSVLDEEEYEKSRLKVYKFLIDGANDGTVPPLMLPGSKKLGSERLSIDGDSLDGNGFRMEAFRSRKLLEYYLEPVSLKYDLPLTETVLLFDLTQFTPVTTSKKLADFTNMSRANLALSIQKLSSRGYVKVEDIRKEESSTERQVQIMFPHTAYPILADLYTAQNDYEQARFAGLSEEEISLYLSLGGKIKNNILKILQKDRISN